MSMRKEAYGLFTVIAMIVGIVVGSGIYFKADDILSYTNGNYLLGLCVLGIGAISIIFGSISLTELAKRTSTSGGLTGYFEQFFSDKVAAGFGWFQTFIYYPSIVAVIAWVSAIYTFILFHIDATLEMQIGLGTGYIVLCSLLNIYSRRLAGYFQNLSTAIKLLPLIIIAIAGLFWTKEAPTLPSGVLPISYGSSDWKWLTALVPLAFSYDGWTISLNIAPEVKNPFKNMTKALIIAPLIILCTYLLFFFGMTRILGTDFILATGDSAITYAISFVLGDNLSRLVIVIITISILGVLNGVILGGMRMPQALAEKQMIRSPKLAKIDAAYQLSLRSGYLFLVLSLLWIGIHYVTQKFDIFAGRDVSEISVVFNYLCYGLLYYVVFRLYRKGQITKTFTGVLAPITAILGSLLIFVGSLLSSFMYVSLFVIFCFIFSTFGYLYYKKAE